MAHALRLLLVFVLVTPVIAQESTPGSEVPIPTLRVETRLVVTSVIVTDKNQRPVHGLQASDFTINEGDDAASG